MLRAAGVRPRLFARHLLSLVLPLLTLSFVAGGPHPAWQSLPGLLVVVFVVWLDGRVRAAAVEPIVPRREWPFTALLCVLAAIQLLTIFFFIRLVARTGFTIDLILIGWFVGNNSGWGTIVLAHELIHRRPRLLNIRWLGRALLWTVLYDHFFVEHLRGHHARVATDEDPATARFGESYTAFFLRTVPAQLRSAWRLSRRQVIVGFLVELLLLGAITVAAGPVALLAFVWQAYNAITLLEAVNYFEHWGLTRAGVRPAATDAWDSDSWLTHYSLIGLARHADHHAHAARPYQALRLADESPKLPRGYYAMVALAQLRNKTFQELMTNELRRRQLGPFRPRVRLGC